MRKRFLHPAVWGDAATVQMTRDERLMFIGMVSIQDDEQRLMASPGYLRGTIYPEDRGLSDAKVERWRDFVCIHNENVWLYEVSGREYIWLAKACPKWQTPSHPTPSQLPPHTKGKRLTAKELLAKHSRKSPEEIARTS